MRSLVTHPAILLATALAVVLTQPPRTASACPRSDAAKVSASASCGAQASAACMTDAKSAAACPAMASGCCAKGAAATAAVTAKAATKSKVPARAAKSVKPARRAVPAAVAKAPAAVPATAGMRAYLDPETGLIGPPSPAQLEEANAVLEAAPANLAPVVLPDGSVVLDLQGTLQDYVLMELGPDGVRTFRCVDGAAHAPTHAHPAASVPQIVER